MEQPSAHVRWIARPELQSPVVIAAFEGWNDAGDSASTAARYLVDRWDAEPFAEIDPEEFHDFTTTRPSVRLEDGERQIDWPTTRFHAARIPGGHRDAVVVLGTEPQLRWRTFCAQVVGAVQAFRPQLVITLGALLAEVPHTRPTTVVGTADDRALVEGFELEPSTYEGPTGIVGVLHAACRQAGLPSASLWATVPSYVPGAPSPKAALALVERTAALLGTSLATTDLEIASASYERQVSELVDADEETQTYVSSLEQRHDDSDELPAPEDFVEQVERFLREQGD